MLNHLTSIFDIVLFSLKDIWFYLLITIPTSVLINLSGAAKYLKTALRGRPYIAILLAALIGALSPFCSCTVVPVIASLLISGVPLAPVMAFWIASPSMDPEIFFLSVTALGWELAVWRLVSALILSVAAGFITNMIANKL
ncbi:MAG: hypothetical protein GF313_11260 [Caldithrix sp.]|nr:hypothetical protein [Caldithrix sp.]